MSTRNDSVLEKGEQWEEATWEEDLKPAPELSAQSRAKMYWAELSRPSILTRRGTGGPRRKLRPTAYLDGLRGFAAFLVYWHHHQLWCREQILGHIIFERGFGFDQKYHFATLPMVRIFFTGGHYSVTTFFVISGYVLSTKPLSLIHAGEFVKLGDNLGSALFRRWVRLFLPVIATTFLYATFWHATGAWIGPAEKQSNYRDEVWWWYCEFKNFSFIYNGGGEPWLSYNMHVWSIPVEFRASIIVYTTLLAFSRCTRNARLCLTVGLIFYFMYIADGAFFAMFAAGMLLCDLDLLAQKDELPSFFYRLEPFKELIFYHLFILSLYLGGIPSVNNDISEIKKVRGWYYLSLLKPQAVYDYKWFYLFWASTLLVASIPRIPWLKRFFETPFNQYLGRISFAFYLIHGPVLWVLGDRIYAATGWWREPHKEHIPGWMNRVPLSKAGPLGFDLAFWGAQLVILPVTLWLAQVTTRFIDEPSVKVAQWMYGKALAPAPPKGP